MSNVDTRVRYYHGQLLIKEDFDTEQQYHLDRQRRHNRYMHTAGWVEGLTIDAKVGSKEIKVSSGTAIDGLGRQLVLLGEHEIPEKDRLSGDVIVVISYPEDETREDSPGRIYEEPLVALKNEQHVKVGEDIVLGKMKIAETGGVESLDTSGTKAVDDSVRVRASAVLGDLPKLKSLTLEVPNVEGQDPVLRGSGPKEAELQGSLHLTGGYIMVEGSLGNDKAKEILKNAEKPCLLIGLSGDQSGLVFYMRNEVGEIRAFKTLSGSEPL